MAASPTTQKQRGEHGRASSVKVRNGFGRACPRHWPSTFLSVSLIVLHVEFAAGRLHAGGEVRPRGGFLLSGASVQQQSTNSTFTPCHQRPARRARQIKFVDLSLRGLSKFFRLGPERQLPTCRSGCKSPAFCARRPARRSGFSIRADRGKNGAISANRYGCIFFFFFFSSGPGKRIVQSQTPGGHDDGLNRSRKDFHAVITTPCRRCRFFFSTPWFVVFNGHRAVCRPRHNSSSAASVTAGLFQSHEYYS